MFRIPQKEVEAFRVKYRFELREVAKRKKFEPSEIEKFFYIFHKLSKSREKIISREKFIEIIDFLINFDKEYLRQRVLVVLTEVKDDGSIDPAVWMRTMEIFFGRSLKDKIEYCFQVYDIDNSGNILKDDVFKFLNGCFTMKSMRQEEIAVKDLIQRIFGKFRAKVNHKITKEEYKDGVLKTPLMLECLGQCLPQIDSKQFFDLLLSQKII
ncbi:hypothetical protein DMENIID0001_055650 [Sergentomyia squamirostris]